MNLAIITARGGSKRIPSKNIRAFLGKPIISYSIEAALRCKIFDEVMVSTDSKRIADISREHGALVPFFRSSKSSDDYATTSDVLYEVIRLYKSMDKAPDVVCCIYPTAPFVTPSMLKDAYEKLTSSPDICTVVPVVKYSYPPQRGLVIDGGLLKMKDPTYRYARSQDLEPMYHDAGQFYMFKAKAFLESRDLWCGKIEPIVVPDTRSQDIDTLEDWVIAEMKYKLITENKS